jgi:hypothetical protein
VRSRIRVSPVPSLSHRRRFRNASLGGRRADRSDFRCKQLLENCSGRGTHYESQRWISSHRPERESLLVASPRLRLAQVCNPSLSGAGMRREHTTGDSQDLCGPVSSVSGALFTKSSDSFTSRRHQPRTPAVADGGRDESGCLVMTSIEILEPSRLPYMYTRRGLIG